MPDMDLISCVVKTFRCSEQIAMKVIESSEKRGELESIKKMVLPVNKEKTK